MEVCSGICVSGKQCKNKPKYDHKDKHYCKTHFPIDECSICMDVITCKNSFKLACGHLMHRACIKRWLSKGRTSTCPLCRTELQESDICTLGCNLGETMPKSFNISVMQVNNEHMSRMVDHDTLVEYLQEMLAPSSASSASNISNNPLQPSMSSILYTITLLS
jgi:Ring finger domain